MKPAWNSVSRAMEILNGMYGIVEFNVPLDTVGHFGDGGPEQ